MVLGGRVLKFPLTAADLSLTTSDRNGTAQNSLVAKCNFEHKCPALHITLRGSENDEERKVRTKYMCKRFMYMWTT